MALRTLASRLTLSNLGGAIVARRPAAGHHAWKTLPLILPPVPNACATPSTASFSSDSLKRSPHVALEEKGLLVERLLQAKAASGKTYDEIADKMGLTNAYVAQLFLNQAQLRPSRVEALRKVVPALSDEDVEDMQRCPYRSFDDSVRDEPLVYRLVEAVLHYGEGLKSIVNEKFGDGIMSAIDFYLTVDKVKGSQGEDRVVITFNGKFLPHIEQTKEGASVGTGRK